MRRFKFNELHSPMFFEIMGLQASSMRREEGCEYLEEPPWGRMRKKEVKKALRCRGSYNALRSYVIPPRIWDQTE